MGDLLWFHKFTKFTDVWLQAGKKDSIGVRLALGETQIVAEIRQFLIDNGVSLDSFSQVMNELCSILCSILFLWLS